MDIVPIPLGDFATAPRSAPESEFGTPVLSPEKFAPNTVFIDATFSTTLPSELKVPEQLRSGAADASSEDDLFADALSTGSSAHATPRNVRKSNAPANDADATANATVTVSARASAGGAVRGRTAGGSDIYLGDDGDVDVDDDIDDDGDRDRDLEDSFSVPSSVSSDEDNSVDAASAQRSRVSPVAAAVPLLNFAGIDVAVTEDDNTAHHGHRRGDDAVAAAAAAAVNIAHMARSEPEAAAEPAHYEPSDLPDSNAEELSARNEPYASADSAAEAESDAGEDADEWEDEY